MRDPIAGDRLDQYQLDEMLARSGMASIFKATDTSSGATVALKIPHLQFESDVVFHQRFTREEQICQRLDHPNIVKVLRPADKSRMYLVMEFVEGKSVRALLQEKTRLPVDQALDIARQVTEALAYLHGQRVVHRDIKPENILLTAEGRVKILDFGIAMDESARRLTWAGLSNTIGTPDYMAPEQIGGRRGDARTDVYAVGTLLYEMVTGDLPFSAPNAHAMMRAKTHDDPKPPGYHVPDVDRHVEAIILRALERAPRDRYATAEALLADLRNPDAVPLREPGGPEEAPRARRRVSRQLVGRLMLAVALVSLGALVWLSYRYTR